MKLVNIIILDIDMIAKTVAWTIEHELNFNSELIKIQIQTYSDPFTERDNPYFKTINKEELNFVIFGTNRFITKRLNPENVKNNDIVPDSVEKFKDLNCKLVYFADKIDNRKFLGLLQDNKKNKIQTKILKNNFDFFQNYVEKDALVNLVNYLKKEILNKYPELI